MKRMGVLKYGFLFSVIFLKCGKAQDVVSPVNELQNSIVDSVNYRDEMRSFVINLSAYAKNVKPSFNIIPQNGIELITEKEDAKGGVYIDYLNAIDALGQENLFYGYKRDNAKTPTSVSEYMVNYLKVSQDYNNEIFVIDYCKSDSNVEDAIEKNLDLDFIPFIAPERDLTVIPEIPESLPISTKNISSLKDANNFLFFVNYSDYDSKNDVIEAISATDYDVVFMDLFFNDGSEFGRTMIESLKVKSDGTKRLVLCYMSIGEAEDYRFYWNTVWHNQKPVWLEEENPNWPGNYKVKYWDPEWQSIIFGSENAYLDAILAVNFDGVYLDIIDGFEYFENKN